MANRLCWFVKMGHMKQLTKLIFYFGGGQLVVHGTKRCNFKHNDDDDDDENGKYDQIFTSQTDNSVGDDGVGDRGRRKG